MQVLSLGMTTTSPVDAVGDVEQYQVTLPTQSEYVLELGGAGSAVAGVWGPYSAGAVLTPIPALGKLRVCGPGSWGMKQFLPGVYLLQTTQNAAGAFTVLFRQSSWPQSWWDAIVTKFSHKSSC